MTRVLKTFRLPGTQDWDNAWIGMEPTFQNRKSIAMWQQCEDEDAYFHDRYLLGVQEEVGRDIKRKYEKRSGEPWCMFDDVDREEDVDPWNTPRQNLKFQWKDRGLPDFEMRFTLDPETWEFSIKPVPLAWFYDDRFVKFLEELVWEVPIKNGLTPSIAHGGCQFSISAKTYLTGTLLADDIAAKLNHPELSTWMLDWPNPDDRPFRATRKRFEAFRAVLERYRKGAFKRGALTTENAFHDRGWESDGGPERTPFQENFAFARAVRLEAQYVHPGYWQSAHPNEIGYRPDQIMRYSEANLNRLQIAGELHVKRGNVLEDERIPEFDAPLEISMLTDEASWENRGQMGRTSARDFVEALLLSVHHARYLQKNPGPAVRPSLLQDRILMDAEKTIPAKTLDRLRREARKLNLEASRGRVKSDWIEPETLFWEAWKALGKSERAEVAREAIALFVEYVEQAASADPRGGGGDPMEWHRHRVHPELWAALGSLKAGDPVRRELEAWREKRDEYLERRPVFSQTEMREPWA